VDPTGHWINGAQRARILAFEVLHGTLVRSLAVILAIVAVALVIWFAAGG
jgi:hypothetical protein